MRGYKHGLRFTRIYRIWLNMKNRCNNPKTWAFDFYGAKGIRVCTEWNDNPKAFYDWAMSNGYDDTLTIDRIDTTGDYSPNNCRWVDMKTQNRNRRSTQLVTWNGKTQCITDWSKELNIPQKTLNWRFHHWDIERSLTIKTNGK